jgi:deazaflavin-dependent oxidoreductase (nitroreductase family)
MRPGTERLLRWAFRLLNKGFMVPAFRLGFGPAMGSPYGGYIMVIKSRGWKSGKTRYTPVNYAIADGCVYCLAGFGTKAHWIKNLESDPNAELLLPGGTVACRAERVEEPAERQRMLRQILINSGFAAFLFGQINPLRASDQKVAELARDYIVLRFRPSGIGAGAFDPGGWFWLWPAAVFIYLIWLLLR